MNWPTFPPAGGLIRPGLPVRTVAFVNVRPGTPVEPWLAAIDTPTTHSMQVVVIAFCREAP